MPDSWISATPSTPPDQRARGRLSLRYEDIGQDGHMLVEALPTSLGQIWKQIERTRPPSSALEQGVVPILSRVVVVSGEGPIAVGGGGEAEGAFLLSHTAGADGAPDRILLSMWADVIAPIGRTNFPPPADAGRPVVAGRVFAEHVFTRLFAAPADRRVRTLDLGAGPFVPPERSTWRAPEDVIALPEGTTLLDREPVASETPTLFGVDHTDSNQHVNSLVYPRLFIEAGLRRLAAHGKRGAWRAKAIEIAYRKPCFAGESARVVARAFVEGDRLGVNATLVADGDAAGARPRCMARMLFER